MRFLRQRALVIPFLLVMAVANALIGAGHYEVAWAVAVSGGAMVLLGNLLYISWRTRSRWPGTNWLQRVTKVVLFEQ